MEQSNPSNVVDLSIFEGATVGTGTYLYFSASSYLSRDGWEVSQVIDISESRDIPVDEMYLAPARVSGATTRSLKLSLSTIAEFAVPEERARFVLLRKMEEASEDVARPAKARFANVHESTMEVVMTTLLRWVPLESVRAEAAIAFVYHLDDIQDGERPCCGQINCFFIRSRWNDNGSIQSIEQGSYDAFFSPHGQRMESFSERISNFIFSLNEKCFKALTGSKATYDSRSKHLHLDGANYEGFQYLDAMALFLSKKSSKPARAAYWSSNRAKKCVNPVDLSISNKKRKVTTHLRRFTMKSQLKALRLVLGSAFAIGPLLQAPNMKQIRSGKLSDTVYLQSDDCVRLVACIGDEFATAYDPKAPLKKRLNYEGIDFQFHRRGGVTDLHVHFIYSRQFGNNHDVRTAQNGGKESLKGAVNPTPFVGPSLSPTTVQGLGNVFVAPTVNVNAEFEFENEICVVTGLDECQHVVQYRRLIDDSDDESQTMNLDQAAELVAIQRRLCKLQFIYFHVGKGAINCVID